MLSTGRRHFVENLALPLGLFLRGCVGTQPVRPASEPRTGPLARLELQPYRTRLRTVTARVGSETSTVLLDTAPVTPTEHTLLRNLYPLYLHDLSEFGDGYPLNEQDLWQPDYMPYWLSGKPDVHRMLFLLKGRPVGFAFVGQAPFPFMTPGRDFRLCEFFILRAERRHGLGGARPPSPCSTGSPACGSCRSCPPIRPPPRSGGA